ncbi:MAG TPA: UDP-N-acetylmuramoyl-L-alanyl-D-glutamate--2,6-diaminopimelate ligase, partial [Desulfobulbaceae bacterium]|nr:UDP-N-acetylmuramoyl-L-alanyl-D-glutamate--2,6-diaminopimelate ligase [Desulfobulbaceae bacterium]
MQLSDLANILAASPQGSLPPDTEITAITADSRQAGAGTVFVALKGACCDGHEYIESAIARGCLAVVAESRPSSPVGVVFFQVTDSHQALGQMACAFYGYPAAGMKLIALTGTNGKTTTSWMLEGILNQPGYRTGVIGTVNYRYVKSDGRQVVQPAPLTTPDPVQLQALLREMADAGVSHVIVEASSHALAQHRLAGIFFDVAVFTNLSRDHLDYHQNMEDYFSAKKKLFTRNMKPSGTAVIVTDSGEGGSYGRRLSQEVVFGTVMSVGFDKSCDVRADDLRSRIDAMTWSLALDKEQYQVRSELTGRYNVLNMLAAAGAASALSVSGEDIAAGLSAVHQVPGRLERVNLPGLAAGECPAVFVDYAHTPDGLANVLAVLGTMTTGRLICVFGCGGDRDTGKRASMGEIAAQMSDVVLLTSDNPRTEDPLTILAQAAAGVRDAGKSERSLEEMFADNNGQNGFQVIADRALAIRQACALAGPDDIVLIAGKGHEQYQILGKEKIFFDDRIQAKNGLAAWTVRHLLAATGGRCIHGAGQPVRMLGAVSTDTRTLQPGDVFLALKGDTFDGHAFVGQAANRGAGALIVADDVDVGESTLPVIQVADTLTALGDLAAYRRRLFGDEVTVIGLTGSSGKTTVKEMVGAICRRFYETGAPAPQAVLKTRGNFNNLIGLPLTLLRLDAEQRVAILEMGMNQPGEIARLTEIADPDIGCINNIQEAHLLGLGTIEGVAAAKGELYRGMDRDGVLVVNGDDPLVVGLARRHPGAKISYAITPAGRRRAPEVRVTRITELGEKGSRITLHVGTWKERFLFPTPGIHNVANAAAAAAIAHAAGMIPESIVAGLADFTNIDKRMEFCRVPGGLRVVNDSYNANPSSMAAALKTMAGFSSGSRKIAALGDMLELGAGSGAAHRRIGRLAAELGYDLLAVTGEYRQDVVTGAMDAGMAKEQVMGFV